MKLSERDKKLLVILGIVAIVALPIFFIIMPLKGKIDDTKGEIATLQERYNYLSGLADQIPFFREETEKYKVQMAEIIEKFPEGIKQENTIMFLLETERNIPISLYQVSFNANDSVPIGTVNSDLSSHIETTQTLGKNYEGVHTQETVGFRVPYPYFKQFINYIEQWEDRLTISNLAASYTLENNEVVGSFTINQYAVLVQGRELEEAEIDVRRGTHNIFSANEEDWEDWLDEEETSMNQGEVIREEDKESEKESEKESDKEPEKIEASNNNATVKGYDCYFMLNQPRAEADAMIVGVTNDTVNKYTIQSDKNRSRLTRFTFTEEDGKFYVTYKLSYRERKHEITPDGDIVLNIYSSNRSGSSDLVESSVAVINETTNKTVQVNIINDDEKRPRITIREKTGKVVVN